MSSGSPWFYFYLASLFCSLLRLIKIFKYLTNMTQLTIKGKFMRRLINHSNFSDDFFAPIKSLLILALYLFYFLLQILSPLVVGTKKIFRFFSIWIFPLTKKNPSSIFTKSQLQFFCPIHV